MRQAVLLFGFVATSALAAGCAAPAKKDPLELIDPSPEPGEDAPPSGAEGNEDNDGVLRGESPGSEGEAPKSKTSPKLQPVLDKLGAQCSALSIGTKCGLAVLDLQTRDTASYDGARKFVSASSAKAIWVAAALDARGSVSVTPEARPIFQYSDDAASARVVLKLSPNDPVAAANAVNTFMWRKAGMNDSAFCTWSEGLTSSSCPHALGDDNYLTANDAVVFLMKLADGTLLSPANTQQLLGWMTWSPRSGWGGWLGTQLPAAVRPKIHHKGGWLPPEAVPGYAVTNDIGIVEINDKRSYVVAILTSGGSTFYYSKQSPLVAYASCVIFHAVAEDVADPFAPCVHP